MQNRIESFAQTSPATGWPFSDPAHAAYFEELCRSHLGTDGQPVVLEDGFARVEGEPVVHGLGNLASRCNLAPLAEWPELVEAHFAKSAPAVLQGLAQSVIEGDFEQQKTRLVVRIQHKDSLSDELLAMHVHRVDLPETRTLLALDLGGSILLVPKCIADSWNVAPGELFERGVQNLRQLGEGSAVTMALPPPIGLQFELYGDDSYGASSVLRFSELPMRTGRYGNLIGLPVRDSMISWPIDSWPSDQLIHTMFAMVDGRYHEGPYPVIPHIYWRKPNGTFQLQRGYRHKNHLQLLASAEFVRMRLRLKRDEKLR